MEEKHTEETVTLLHTCFTKMLHMLCQSFGMEFFPFSLELVSIIPTCISVTIFSLLHYLLCGLLFMILNLKKKNFLQTTSTTRLGLEVLICNYFIFVID